MQRPLTEQLDNLTDWYENAIERFQAWKRWHRATGYLDMCRINADRLIAARDTLIAEGAHAETIEAFTAQILLNQCGVFTYYAQPGWVDLREDDTSGSDPIEHRAMVLTLASDAMKDRFEDRLWRRGHLDHSMKPTQDPTSRYSMLVHELHDPENRTKYGNVGEAAHRGLPVSRVRRAGDDGPYREVVGRVGDQLTAAQIHDLFPVRPDAAAQLYRGWQFAMYADNFGTSNLFATIIEICEAELEIRGLFEPTDEELSQA